MSHVNEVLDTSKPRALHPELTLLSSVDKFSVANGGDVNQPLVTDESLSRLDILLIIVSVLIAVAIMYYVYIQWNERRCFDQNAQDMSVKSEGDNGDDLFVDEDLNFAPYRDGREDNGAVL